MVKINVKWLGFVLFVWLIGTFLGLTYEGSWASANESKSRMETLLSPSESTWATSTGEVTWWSSTTGYLGAWLGVLVWDFPFLDDYDVDGDDIADEGTNTFGKYAGYFVRLFGIVGLAALIFTMLQIFQGFIPGT